MLHILVIELDENDVPLEWRQTLMTDKRKLATMDLEAIKLSKSYIAGIPHKI